MDNSFKKMLITELSAEQITGIVSQAVSTQLQSVDKRIQNLQDALKSDRPAFDREMAAWYCNKSIGWIDKRRQKDNLPCHKVGSTPYFKRKHLDHLITGGKFDENGSPVSLQGANQNFKEVQKPVDGRRAC